MVKAPLVQWCPQANFRSPFFKGRSGNGKDPPHRITGHGNPNHAQSEHHLRGSHLKKEHCELEDPENYKNTFICY
jgi:hypothetical protein